MAHEVLKSLSDEYADLQKSIDDVEHIAHEQGRELTTGDIELVERTQHRQADVARQIDVLSKQVELSESAKTRIAQLRGGVVAGGAVEYRSIGAYMVDYIRSLADNNPTQQREAQNRIQTFNRAAQHITSDDYTDVIPSVVLGPTISFIDASRPLITTVGARPVPGAPSFRRPRLVDTNFTTGVGVQTVQKSELVSQKWGFESDTVEMTTLGGYVNVARQVIDWGISSMQQIVDQLAARYAYATEAAALAELQLSAGHVPLAAGASAADTIQAIWDASALYYTTTGQMPTTLVVGPTGWAMLGGLSDTAGRPILPFLNPSNAAGSMSGAGSLAGNPAGLQLVVTPAITTTDMWLLGPAALEVYEQTVGQLSVVEPSVLGIQVSYSGYFGAYRPAADGAIRIGA